MNKAFYALLAVAVFASCAETVTETYTIKGASSVSLLDGGKLYLQAFRDSSLKSIDSCDVIHGSFALSGSLDTTSIGQLFMEQRLTIPIVLEKGDINVTIDRTAQRVSGTPLNDLLYEYLDRHIQIINRGRELERRATQMLLEGYDEQEIESQLQAERAELPQQKDSLETHFIIENFDNVLGPFAFQMLTEEILQITGYPVKTPQIEEILSKATDAFKNNMYVSEYCKAADDIMARMKGELPEDDVPGGSMSPTPQTSQP